jgi:hypothetical protein
MAATGEKEPLRAGKDDLSASMGGTCAAVLLRKSPIQIGGQWHRSVAVFLGRRLFGSFRAGRWEQLPC